MAQLKYDQRRKHPKLTTPLAYARWLFLDVLHPQGTFRHNWDLFLIVAMLILLFDVLMVFSFSRDSPIFRNHRWTIDLFFFLDILVIFRCASIFDHVQLQKRSDCQVYCVALRAFLDIRVIFRCASIFDHVQLQKRSDCQVYCVALRAFLDIRVIFRCALCFPAPHLEQALETRPSSWDAECMLSADADYRTCP